MHTSLSLHNASIIADIYIYVFSVCDLVNIMAYDFHGAWDKDKLGHHAPLFAGPFGESSALNMVCQIHWLATKR